MLAETCTGSYTKPKVSYFQSRLMPVPCISCERGQWGDTRYGSQYWSLAAGSTTLWRTSPKWFWVDTMCPRPRSGKWCWGHSGKPTKQQTQNIQYFPPPLILKDACQFFFMVMKAVALPEDPLWFWVGKQSYLTMVLVFATIQRN